MSKTALAIVAFGFSVLSACGGTTTSEIPEADAIEEAVLAVNAEMTQAGESADADRLFSFILETDKGSIIQNGRFFVTRGEALEEVKKNLGRIEAVDYLWTRRFVTVLSPELALLTAEGESTATTVNGETFKTPFAQTMVFVLKQGEWKVLHAHQSSPPVPR